MVTTLITYNIDRNTLHKNNLNTQDIVPHTKLLYGFRRLRAWDLQCLGQWD